MCMQIVTVPLVKVTMAIGMPKRLTGRLTLVHANGMQRKPIATFHMQSPKLPVAIVPLLKWKHTMDIEMLEKLTELPA